MTPFLFVAALAAAAPTSSTPWSLEGVLEESREDRAGAWGVFGPGAGSANRDPADWKLRITLTTAAPRAIQGITVIHHQPGEAWSTTGEPVFNKPTYPVVVTAHGRVLNTAARQLLGTADGRTELVLYMQRESLEFQGARIIVTFTDGSAVTGDVHKAWIPRGRLPTCDETGRFLPGRAWTVREGRWAGTWLRRGDTGVFDATWTDALGNTVTDEVRLEGESGGVVRLFRAGTGGRYHGVLSCDRTRITWGVGEWFLPGETWSATITP